MISKRLCFAFPLLAAFSIPTLAEPMIGLSPDLSLGLLGTAEAAAMEATFPENGKFEFRDFAGMAISGATWGISVYDAADPETYYGREFWYGALVTTSAVLASKAMLHFPDWSFEPVLLAGMYGSNTMGLGYRVGWQSYSVTFAKGSFGDESVGAPSPTLLYGDMASVSFAYTFRISPRWSASPELGYRSTEAVVSDDYKNVDRSTVRYISTLLHADVRVFDRIHLRASLGTDVPADLHSSRFLSRNGFFAVQPIGGFALGYGFGKAGHRPEIAGSNSP